MPGPTRSEIERAIEDLSDLGGSGDDLPMAGMFAVLPRLVHGGDVSLDLEERRAMIDGAPHRLREHCAEKLAGLSGAYAHTSAADAPETTPDEP